MSRLSPVRLEQTSVDLAVQQRAETGLHKSMLRAAFLKQSTKLIDPCTIKIYTMLSLIQTISQSRVFLTAVYCVFQRSDDVSTAYNAVNENSTPSLQLLCTIIQLYIIIAAIVVAGAFAMGRTHILATTRSEAIKKCIAGIYDGIANDIC
jgi:hypothetical protein